MDNKNIVSSVRILSPSRKEITVEIPAAETAREYDLAVERFASRAAMPGFRQGKVPRDIVRKKFAGEIERILIDALAPPSLQESFREHSLEPVGVPVLREIEFGEGRPLRFKAEIDVLPECDVSEYTKIKVTKKDIKVEEEEVDRYLEQLRQRSAEYLPVRGRGVVEGDYVAVETQGLDLKANKKFPLEKSVILAGPSEDNPLAGKILGLAEGDETGFEWDYPAGHPDKRMAGKTVSFRVKVLAIKEKTLPALDDDLAKTLGEFENMESLRQRVRDDLAQAKEKAFRAEAARDILDRLSAHVPDDLPLSLVEQESQDLLRKFLESPESQGLAAGGGESVEDIKTRLRRQAERTVKNQIILKTVAARENLKVGEAEIEEEIRQLARSARIPEARLRGHLEEEGRMDGLRERLLFRKTVDFLVDQAIM